MIVQSRLSPYSSRLRQLHGVFVAPVQLWMGLFYNRCFAPGDVSPSEANSTSPFFYGPRPTLCVIDSAYGRQCPPGTVCREKIDDCMSAPDLFFDPSSISLTVHLRGHVMRSCDRAIRLESFVRCDQLQ